MDLSDYEDEFADAIPVPPPFTAYPMPISYPAPPPPDPLRTTTLVPPSPTPVSTTPLKSIHTIISPPENTLSTFLTNLTIPDPLPSFMNEGPQPAAPHVSEMDDDLKIQNLEQIPRRPPIPPSPFTPYQNQDPKQFFTLDDIPVSKWASQIADFHAWINAELLHEGASTVTVLSKFVARLQGKLREWYLALGSYRQLQIVQLTESQFITTLYQEFLGPVSNDFSKARDEFLQMKCCSLLRPDLDRHFSRMTDRFHKIGGIDDENLKQNPYVMSADPCGSSTGSAISVATDLVTVSLGTETDGSIICPSAYNSVVGIKPTLGLTSRAGVVPISPRQDTVGPICRTVSDAVYVLDAIVGYDPYDNATAAASNFIPPGGYLQFLNPNGLQGKRIGILRNPYFIYPNGSLIAQAFQNHFQILRQNGAILVGNLEIANISAILDSNQSGEGIALETEFKIALASYLSGLIVSPIRTLADAISFNLNYSTFEMIPQWGQDVFLQAENTTGSGSPAYEAALANMQSLTANEVVKLMTDYKLDAVVTPNATFTSVLATGGSPGISVPAGYGPDGSSFGICFSGLQGYEPRLIEIAYAFEQLTKIRKPPSYLG
ncbi:probable amidase At4g34880 [Macadamia integrifolia]|uniref:probable amidase At4g34880 n=1 Tax=Macadamia integrifolia TaxID=60698 RepID=UPI001C52AC9F|nr:probable amidase At4g34880 [Macadamia integrifolia]